MDDDYMNPEVLVTLNNEIVAGSVVSALYAHGIRAGITWDYTVGSPDMVRVVVGRADIARARQILQETCQESADEASGMVRVVVRRADVAQARQILQETCQESAKIDWSTIDVGDDHPPFDQEDLPAETDSRKKSGHFQFSIRSLLILQTIVGVALSLWQGMHIALYGVFVVATTIIILPLAGTVAVASNPERARQAWTYKGWALFVSLLVFGFILLLAEILKP